MAKNFEEIQESYFQWSQKSKQLMEPARRYMPGGDTRTTAHYLPYPVFMKKGAGCRIYDADGHEYIDFMNNFTTLILGHAHPKVVGAVADQVKLGTAYAAPTESQFELARLICERVPSVEQLRFCSSGSEATMMAIRAARAFTGKQKVMKIEGGYNGNHDIGEISLVAIPTEAGPFEEPITLQPDKGVPLSSVDGVIVTPFNEPEITEKLIKKHRDELCAIIMEPMMGALGMIAPMPGYLQEMRRITKENEVLLIFDEVITLRLSPAGLQGMAGIEPDLTAMGKIIGGGLPIGAFGGRKDIMQLFSPETADFMWHASTFSGNPLTIAAGLACMRELTPQVYDRLNAAGDALRKGFNIAFDEIGIRGQATGLGSLVNLHMTDRPIRNARDSITGLFGAGPIPMHLHLCMLQRGIFPAGRQMYCVSTPMTAKEIEKAVGALTETLQELKPILEEDFPHLLKS
ncbi:MAG: aspartate aminotransferase family protein [Candidatus Abyssobacteria bacterium SURF_5]|uniref:Glutamate-1-semialdehyde 2,1-aminomutase n=1 Tax=Abyssobacteria bacterium (strain SURF_5) TaxID=2093360 RepID=A0A3A4P5P6_ABYX5|nr:MAG: aspartate aminotransferase family protein [Candidatus Abyssubacteria bacterium SURF_5]